MALKMAFTDIAEAKAALGEAEARGAKTEGALREKLDGFHGENVAEGAKLGRQKAQCFGSAEFAQLRADAADPSLEHPKLAKLREILRAHFARAHTQL